MLERIKNVSVARKNRRSINCNGIEYVWYLRNDEDCCNRLVLHIVSDDKSKVVG